MAPHSSILAWKIPRAEESGGLQSPGLPRVGHDWVTENHTTMAIELYTLSFFKKWVAKWLNCTVHYIAHPLKRDLYSVIILPSKMTLNPYENDNGKHVWTCTHTHTHTHTLIGVLLNCRVTSCLSFIIKVMCRSRHSSPRQNGMVSPPKFVR